MTVLSFLQNKFEPTGRNRCPIADRWSSRPEVLRLGNSAHLTRSRDEIAKIHPGRKLTQGDIGGEAFNLDPIQLA
ncbi:MAG: hypothetical protein A3H93_20515 [Rhodocyclales bacterium RIFCSPLOWO2_02_FULL_63_24]|nr:MAG: hypothetical protein A3H93_20515 [Rhodocyclales bacterium RIFCSPLOWO2_02_FULL_63_24]